MMLSLAVVMVGIVILLSLGGQAADAAAQQAPKPSAYSHVEQEAIKVNKQLDQAHIGPNLAALERIWADDVTFSLPDGRVYDKAQGLELIKKIMSDGFRYEQVTSTDVRVRVFGQTAIVNGRGNSRGRDKDGREVKQSQQYTN